MSPPTGLRYSERELWDHCPEARDALFRLTRMREGYAILLDLGNEMASRIFEQWEGPDDPRSEAAEAWRGSIGVGPRRTS